MGDILEVTFSDDGGTPVVRASGEVDVSSAPELRAVLMTLPESSVKVVVDLSDVTFLDSTGLGVLVAAMKRFREGGATGSMHLVVTRPQILKVLEVTGLTSLFVVHDSLDGALGR